MKNKFISKRYWQDQSTPMGKVDELAKQYDDIIRLSLGDPDLITPDLIMKEAFKDAYAGHTKYTDFRGDPELRTEIAKFYMEEYDTQINDEEIFVVAGACLGMYLILESILDDGDEVILQAPYFTPYKQQVELARGIPIELSTYEEEAFQINPQRLKNLITNKTKALIINTPNNPSGSCQTRQTMEYIADVAQRHDILIIADDIYTAYSFSSPFIPMTSLPGMKERTITINSCSKDFTMTGWRIGNIIAPSRIIKTIQQVNENVMFTAPSVSQRAYIYALKNRKQLQPLIVEAFKKRVMYAYERIGKIPNMHVLSPMGTFYLWVNIKKTGLTSAAVSECILEEAHVVTIPGNSFGECGEGYIRIACTVDVDILKEAFDRIENVSIFRV